MCGGAVRRAWIVVALAACDGGDGEDNPITPDASQSMIDAPLSVDARPPTPDGSVITPDAPSGPPPGSKRVFVSSLRYSADLRSAGGQATGLASADYICQNLADAAQVGGAWKAWISTSTVNAVDRITGNGPWYRMDGQLAFPNRARLGTTPLVPILIDEMGGQPDPFYEAWTGTALGGFKAPLGSRQSVTCADWTSTIDSTQVGGVVGDIDANSSSWTNLATGYCSPFHRRLYCFEQ
jgi:hypothetical protein